MRLWPRLPLPRARVTAAEVASLTVEQLSRLPVNREASRLFAPTGGIRVDDVVVRDLRTRLEGIASGAGFPAIVRRDGRARFDNDASQFLVDYPMSPGEALRPEVWAWIAVVLVPHLVKWRWAGENGAVALERFAGGVTRNALGRLWYQGMSLDRGRSEPQRWLYSQSFGADQAVALLERPSLAGNRRICLAVGKVWTSLPEAKRKEELFRQTMKALIVRGGLIRLDVLGADAMEEVVRACFVVTMQRLGLG